MKQKKRDIIDAYLFLFPNIIGFTVFALVPVIGAFAISFTNWDGMNHFNVIGIRNFIELFQHDSFLIALLNTTYFSIGSVPLQLVLALFTAVALNQKIKGIKIYRSIYFMPYVCSMVAVSFVWTALLHPSYGPVNMILKTIGITNPPSWLTHKDWAMPAIIGMSVWKNFGYFCVIYIAGLQSIPGHLYEAATIDGANGWRKFINITVPMLAPTTFYNVIIATIGSFKVFDQVYIMTEGGPGRATTTLVQYIYQQSFQYFRMGYASAAAFVLFLIIFTITVIQFKGQKKWVKYI